MDYQGIKIPRSVIIVEKAGKADAEPRQGFVADPGNEGMLDTAHSWGRCTVYDDSIADWNERRKTASIEQPTDHPYENGGFSLELLESASWSSQGGKLSFWDCLVTAPDGKQYVIGINSELLLHLMKSCSFDKGRCAQRIWFGRVRGSQVGAFWEGMPEFAQAQEDEKTRNAKKTSLYGEGDVVATLRETYLCVGDLWVYADVFQTGDRPSNQTAVIGKPRWVVGLVGRGSDGGWSDDCVILSDRRTPRIRLPERDPEAAKAIRARLGSFIARTQGGIPAGREWQGWGGGWENSALVRTDPSIDPREVGADFERIFPMRKEAVHDWRGSRDGETWSRPKVVYAGTAAAEPKGWWEEREIGSVRVPPKEG